MRRLIVSAVLLLIGGFVLPIGAYLFGGRVAGPYAGPRGLASYLGMIYADVGHGRPLAILLVLAPLLCVAIWWLRRWGLDRLAERTGDQ